MPVPGGGFDQCYNAQASLDVETMLIIGRHLSQNSNDKLEIESTLEALSALPESLGTVDTLLADSGYFSHRNVVRWLEQEILPYISPRIRGLSPDAFQFACDYAGPGNIRQQRNAREAGMNMTTFYRKLKKSDIKKKDYS